MGLSPALYPTGITPPTCRAQSKARARFYLSRGENEKQGKERQMNFRYRQALKCKNPKPDSSAYKCPLRGAMGKGDVEGAMVTEEEEPCPIQGQHKQGKGPRQALCISSSLTSPLLFTPSQINHQGGVRLQRYCSHPPYPSHCSFPTPQSSAVC